MTTDEEKTNLILTVEGAVRIGMIVSLLGSTWRSL